LPASSTITTALPGGTALAPPLDRHPFRVSLDPPAFAGEGTNIDIRQL
jgi:hypothetical protein